ncbi:MAG: hypothetical protein MUE74_03400 [Bacteroidales bacterium]|jgi:hypothetical protein|nr:hypothetical protein [Bacteroidales bacterium]
MKTALEKSKDLPPQKLAYSARNIVRIQRFLPLFESSIQQQRQSANTRNTRGKEYNEALRKAKIYLTHFIRVMNMAIFRGELPPETRAFYGLATNDPSVPPLTTENDLIVWGKRIIEGEEQRIRRGGSPITNPTIAVVKVRYQSFVEQYNYHKVLIKKTLDYVERTADMRKEADGIILELWNEIEEAHKHLEEDDRRQECEGYGLVYFFRKNELEKINESSQEILTENVVSELMEEDTANLQSIQIRYI